uniref:Uncharacterized protein n=1 Tax=Tanacetum cinerariifolium TaxID=118510 RepID=A0A699KCP2_TANCI|nr:hypothetical protein [Tanacetum cinerariifolium]
MSSTKIEQIIAQRVTNAIVAIAIYEAKNRVARDSMDQVARQGEKVVKDVKNKRKWENGYDRKSSQQQSEQEKVEKACAAGPNNKRGHYKNRCPRVKNQKHCNQKENNRKAYGRTLAPAQITLMLRSKCVNSGWEPRGDVEDGFCVFLHSMQTVKPVSLN